MTVLSELARDLRQVERTLAAASRDLAELPDHEQRLRALERYRYALPATLISSLIAAAAAVIGAWGR